jgi:hypothetical protein
MRMLIVIAIALFAAGCGSSDAPESDQPESDVPVLTDGALVIYSRTGGVGGIDERLRIEPDGSATVMIGEPMNTERSFELSATELDDVQALLDSADLEAMPTEAQPTGCADCFVYTVEYGGRSVTYDDATEPEPSVGELVTGLDDLVTEHQPVSAGYIKGG